MTRSLPLPNSAALELGQLALHDGDPVAVWVDTNHAARPFTREWLEVHDNPQWDGSEDDPQWQLVVPMSGGLDSLTLLHRAQQSGLRPTPVYVDTGAPYTRSEITAARQLLELVELGADALVVVEVPCRFQTLAGYVDLGRNAVIAWTCASLFGPTRWGEVWFGNVSDWQESPIRGGDKSHRFFATIQQVVTMWGWDVRIQSPLTGQTKPDLLAWWAFHGRPDIAARSFSCYGPGPFHCGRCRACFKRWLAFGAAGLDHLLMWPDGLDVAAHADAFWRAVHTDPSPAMAPARWARPARFLAATHPDPHR